VRVNNTIPYQTHNLLLWCWGNLWDSCLTPAVPLSFLLSHLKKTNKQKFIIRLLASLFLVIISTDSRENFDFSWCEIDWIMWRIDWFGHTSRRRTLFIPWFDILNLSEVINMLTDNTWSYVFLCIMRSNRLHYL